MASDDNYKTSVLAYNVRVKQKHSRKGVLLSSSTIHTLLGIIRRLPYERTRSPTRYQKVGDVFLALDFLSFPDFNNKGITQIDFFLGKETKETFPTRDKKGDFNVSKLPIDENLCFKTHGRILFKKIDGEWCCILLLERRWHTTGIWKLKKYIEILNSNEKLILDPIIRGSDLLTRIKRIHSLKGLILKDQKIEFSPENRLGTIHRRVKEGKTLSKTEIQINTLVGATPVQKIGNFLKLYCGSSAKLNQITLSNFVDETKLVLIGRESGEKTSKRINLFDDLASYTIIVDKLDTRDIDTADFFSKLSLAVNASENAALLDLSRQVYNHE